jgi:Fe-S cluster biogenesis protein NfuA
MQKHVMDPRDRIEQVLDTIRPALRSDGGDVELIDFDVEDGIVHLRLMGACGSCPVSMLTLKQGIERRIVGVVPEVRGVNAL